jgi:hypothetical protein
LPMSVCGRKLSELIQILPSLPTDRTCRFKVWPHRRFRSRPTKYASL